jgi:hypothetical protein
VTAVRRRSSGTSRASTSTVGGPGAGEPTVLLIRIDRIRANNGLTWSTLLHHRRDVTMPLDEHRSWTTTPRLDHHRDAIADRPVPGGETGLVDFSDSDPGIDASGVRLLGEMLAYRMNRVPRWRTWFLQLLGTAARWPTSVQITFPVRPTDRVRGPVPRGTQVIAETPGGGAPRCSADRRLVC